MKQKTFTCAKAVIALTCMGAPTWAQSAADLKQGRYVCSMSSAGGQFPITIGRGTYTDRAGKSGTFSVTGDRITFGSGSLAGQYSRILGPGKFGLSSSFNGMFYGVCNLNQAPK